jgi:potassium/chloride transporter 4/5/6
VPIPLVLCKPWGILPESMPCHPKLLSFCKYLHERGEKVSGVLLLGAEK